MRSIRETVGRVLVSGAAIALASCWNFSDYPGDWCTCDNGDTTCSSWGTIGVCEDGCHYTYVGCDALCVDEGWERSAGCDWDSGSGGYACLCTDEISCDCSSGETGCWGSDSLLSCDDGCFWTEWDCDRLCADAGWDASTGCGYDSSSGGDACTCEDLPDCECSAGETDCWGDSILSCDDGCWWSEWDCYSLCVDSGYDRSTGCGYDSYSGGDSCFCESDPVCECSYGEMACLDSYYIGSCDDGCTFTGYSCDDLCVDAGYSYSTGCGWDSSGYTCFCES